MDASSVERVIEVPAELNVPREVSVDGQYVWAALSPFDFPHHARIVCREFEDKVRISTRLMYDVANDEEVEKKHKQAGLTINIGKKSGRVLGFEVVLKQPVAADLGPHMERVREFLFDLKTKTIAEPRTFVVRRNAHFEMLNSLLPIVANSIRHLRLLTATPA